MRPVLLTALLGCLGLAACNRPPMPPSDAPVRSTAPAASSQMPQSPNSLPDGARVNAPVTSPVGNVGTTRVVPAR